MASILLKFDKSNSCKDFQMIAEDITGESHIGYIVVEKPWCEPESNFTYWLYENKSTPNNFCGGATDYLDRTEVVKDTIRPYNQIEEIRNYLKTGLKVILQDNITNGNIVAEINSEDDIPYQLYNN